MSKVAELILEVQDEIEIGELSFSQIASKYNVPLSWVIEASEMLVDQTVEICPDVYPTLSELTEDPPF